MKNEYDKIKDEYSDFLREIKRIVEKLLNQNSIPIAFNIYGRLKDFDSIQEKHNSKRFVIKKTITELNDLVGLRIVLLFPEYKNQVIDLLLGEFNQIVEFKKDNQTLDKFGYSSIHLILGIREEWIKAPDWKEHYGKKIEIQIRTLSEHIWAETSHSLFYKREENIPKIITRDLYRLSALLEVVDDKLQSIKDNVSQHFKYIESCPFDEILRMDLNSETFRRAMREYSNGNYDLNDNQNKELSSRIEHDYNILNVIVLHELVAGKIDSKNYTNEKFIGDLLLVLESEQIKREKKRENSD
jgi:ppGpp synthetase/RelA/SpoT-type nucleotidyltranferase